MRVAASRPAKRMFATTNWTELRKLAEVPNPSEAERAGFEQFCERYWHAVFAVIRFRLNEAELARDLTQKFFLKHLLEKNGLAGFDPSRGRFRSWLWRRISWFLLDEQRAARGSSNPPAHEGASATAPFELATMQDYYERRYAVALAEQAMSTVQAAWHEKLARRGKKILPETLLSWLVDRNFGSIAEQLGISYLQRSSEGRGAAAGRPRHPARGARARDRRR